MRVWGPCSYLPNGSIVASCFLLSDPGSVSVVSYAAPTSQLAGVAVGFALELSCTCDVSLAVFKDLSSKKSPATRIARRAPKP